MDDRHQATDCAVIAINGKVLRGSYDKGRRQGAIQMVSAFSAANQIVIRQVKTSEKSNQVTTIPEPLNLLDIHEYLVTIDAMECQSDIANIIVDRGADYLLAVIANQKRLGIYLMMTLEWRCCKTSKKVIQYSRKRR